MDGAVFYSLLKISNSSELKKFLHECVDDLIERRKLNFDNYNSESIEWTKDDFEKAKKDIQIFYRNCVVENNCNIRLENVAHIQECIQSVFEVRRKDIFQYLARTYVLKNGNNLIENIDWRLKWVLGSSDLSVLKEPFLQIDLNGAKHDQGKTAKTSVFFEASLDQVDQIIKELTTVKKELSLK